MTGRDGGWPSDFPPVMHFVDPLNVSAKPWRFMEMHPDYDAAKNHEDEQAAARLVEGLLSTPENQAQLKTIRQKYPDAIVVPVHAVEANGKNRIPVMLAEYIGKRAGLEMDRSIVQTNRVHRTGNDSWHRFAFRPAFEGDVKTGRQYILVDDVFSNGGSFNELRLFIERNGGRVVQTAAMSLGGHGDKIAPEPELFKSLVDKYGPDKLQSFLKEIDVYDGNYKALTNPEVFALRRAPSLDEARDRILEARQAGMSRESEEAVLSRKTPPIDPEGLHRRYGRHW